LPVFDNAIRGVNYDHDNEANWSYHTNGDQHREHLVGDTSPGQRPSQKDWIDMSKMQWRGYLHTNGTVQIKRYFTELDIEEALESPFVKRVSGPIESGSQAEAAAQLTSALGAPR
jgi:hypothetical protein